MGFFSKLGRHIEQFNQKARQAAAETADYECQSCHARFQTPFEECPDCGAHDVAPRTNAE
ncbi:MAG: hypothetical protein ACOCY6_04895 [Halodesulfurarchaeum sp.]